MRTLKVPLFERSGKQPPEPLTTQLRLLLDSADPADVSVAVFEAAPGPVKAMLAVMLVNDRGK